MDDIRDLSSLMSTGHQEGCERSDDDVDHCLFSNGVRDLVFAERTVLPKEKPTTTRTFGGS
jgi:hypothetical protein